MKTGCDDCRVKMRIFLVLAIVAAALLPRVPAGAEMRLPAGFRAQVYVTGEGYEAGGARSIRGFPSSATLAFDRQGLLYLARTGRRYLGGEVEDLLAVYRIPVGGARLSPDTEVRYVYGPPLRNPQVSAIGAGRELVVTTFDRERRVGVLYRVRDGRAEFVAGGTPPPGEEALLRQPEGVVADQAGNLYVADRAQATVVKLDATGRVLNPRWASVLRPRALAMDEADRLWIGADGSAETPWQRGPGEIWAVGPGGVANLVLRGPMPAGISTGPGGYLAVADRHAAQIFFVSPEGRLLEFATFTDGDAPRSLRFAPDTPQTRQAGIAGDLFVVTISQGTWPVNEVVRISGPFEEFVRQSRGQP
jgi:hypothetical protein